MLPIFLFAFILHFSAIYFSVNAGFYYSISDEVIMYSTADLVLSCVVVFFVFIRFNQVRNTFTFSSVHNWEKVFLKHKFIILALVFYAAYLAYKSFGLIMQGVARHQLISEYDTAGFDYMILSGFFKLTFPFALLFIKDYKIKIMLFIGLLLCLVITASRSELRYVLNFLLIYMLFFQGAEFLKKFSILAATGLIFIILATLVTVFIQNRPMSDGLYSMLDLIKSVLQYQAYGYYLAEISIEAGASIDKALYPFFGYVSEFMSKLLGGSVTPIDSEFVGELHVIGTSTVHGRPFLANVVYPWWSWFVAYFGAAGLLIKAIFIFCFLSLLLNFRMMFSLVLLLSFVILGTAAAHPFLTLTHTVSFAVAICIDIYILMFAKFSKSRSS